MVRWGCAVLSDLVWRRIQELSFGCESCKAAGIQKFRVSGTEASLLDEFDEVNVPELLVQTLCWHSGPHSCRP